MNSLHLRSTLLAACVIVLSACAAFAGAPSELTLHQQDAGHQYKIHVGDTVKLDLLDSFGVPGSSVTWNADSSNAIVLSRTSTNRETPNRLFGSTAHYVATFRAQKAGSATIEMVGTARCEAMNPAFCHQPSESIAVTVS